jgi:hypothetical protein
LILTEYLLGRALRVLRLACRYGLDVRGDVLCALLTECGRLASGGGALAAALALLQVACLLLLTVTSGC